MSETGEYDSVVLRTSETGEYVVEEHKHQSPKTSRTYREMIPIVARRECGAANQANVSPISQSCLPVHNQYHHCPLRK